LLIGCVFAAHVRGEDRITLLDSRQQPVTRAGQIVQYDADQLQLQSAQGTVSRVSVSRLLKIETDRCPEHQQADEAFAQGDHAGALRLYQAAYRNESRAWVKELLVARAIACQTNLGQAGAAASMFLALLEQAPKTPHVAMVPLAWRAEQADRTLSAQADQWLNDPQRPAARLIAASWLLSGPRRADAQKELAALVQIRSTGWLGVMAECQLWRTRTVTADAEEVQRWQAALQRISAGLQAGPLFLIAQAQTRLQQTDAAVLSYLQVALMHAEQHTLATESLWEAAQLLQRAQHIDEARRLYQQLSEQAADSPLATEARRKLQELEPAP
jgi:hypothetical protein